MSNTNTTNTTANNAAAEIVELGASIEFQNQVKTAEKAGLAHCASLRVTLKECLAAAKKYLENDAGHRKALVLWLKSRCTAAGIGHTDETTVPHLIVKLAFKSIPKLTSGYAHVVHVALSHGITLDDFESWILRERGIQEIRKTYHPNGKKKNPGKKPLTAEGIQKLVADGKKRLASSVLCKVESPQFKEDVMPVYTKTDCVAIVVRYADGSFEVKEFVFDQKVIDAAYFKFGKPTENTEVSSGASNAAPQISEEVLAATKAKLA